MAAAQVKEEVKQAAPSKANNQHVDLDEAFKKECFKNTAALIAKTKEINNPVLNEAVKLYLDLYNSQLAVFECKIACAKPAKFDALTALPKKVKKQIFDLGKKDRKIGIHLRTLEDTTDLFTWFSLPVDPEKFPEGLKELAGGMDFQGMKLCSSPYKEIDKLWYRALRTVQQDLATFLNV